jgi:hypothetical protein
MGLSGRFLLSGTARCTVRAFRTNGGAQRKGETPVMPPEFILQKRDN